MIDTVHLVPPGFGPKADPLLFGVSEGLQRLFPLPAADRPSGAAPCRLEPDPVARPDAASVQAPLAAKKV